MTSRRTRAAPETVDAPIYHSDGKMTDNTLAAPRAGSGWAMYSKVRFIGVLTLVLSLVPMIVGMVLFQGLMRPHNLALRHFDAAFRRVGALLPFVALSLRALGTWLHQEWATANMPKVRFFLLWDTMWLYASFQLLRFLVYLLHLIAQEQHTNGEQLMSDHALLAISVQSCLAIEVVVTTQLTVVAFKSRRNGAWFILASCVAWVLLVLTSFDMYNTTRYFHDQSESFTALLFGCALFVFPAIVLLLMPWRPRGGGSEVLQDQAGVELASQQE